jgi:hypothetical protein
MKEELKKTKQSIAKHKAEVDLRQHLIQSKLARARHYVEQLKRLEHGQQPVR